MENLVIINKGIATIEWDKEKALQEAKEIMAKYEGLQFTEEDLPRAKKEVATLRKVSKEINSQALAIDKELTAPVKTFRSEVKEVKAIVDEGINYINEQVKTFEEAIKLDRQNEIMSWEEWEAIKEYVSFNESWLLKKWNDKVLKMEFGDIKYQLGKDLETLKTTCDTLGLDSELYSIKLKSSPLNEVVARMNEDYELLNKKEEKKIDPVIEVKPNDKVITITRKITGTEEQLIALKQYALKLGVEYK